MLEKKTSRPAQPRIDSSGYRLYSTGEAAKLLNISIQTVRSWCESGRLISTRGQSSGKRAGNRYISESELQRIRSDNAFTTVNEAVNRMQAIIDDRDATIIDLISEKSHVHSHNFEVTGKKIDAIAKRLDRLGAAHAKPPAIRLSDKTIRHIAEVVLAASNGGHGIILPQDTAKPGNGDSAHSAQRVSAGGLQDHHRSVSRRDRDRMIGELS